ncbi:MAG: hypothetical protein WC829_02285 [Hyphomicrobium sp.]|jgi:hypothetical protein
MDLDTWLLKTIGSAIGVLISMVMIRPKNWLNALYRAALGTVAGAIFAPSVMGLFWFLQGDDADHYLQAAALSGFVAWFVLEFIARMISSEDTLKRLLEEIMRIRGSDKK